MTQGNKNPNRLIKILESAILGTLVAIVALLWAFYSSRSQDVTMNQQLTQQAVQNALLREQLDVLSELATLQANSVGFGPTATEIAKQRQILESTAVVLATKVASLPHTSILFYEDFEDGIAEGISDIKGNWTVISDGNSNKIYEGQSTNEYSQVDFGSSAWKNYEIEYDVKMLNIIKEAPEVILGFRSNLDNSTGYVQYITPYYNVLGLDKQTTENGWPGITTREYSFKTDKWYRVRIRAEGSRLQIYVDDTLYIDKTDPDFSSGSLVLSIGPNAHVLIDNIKVTEIGQ